MADIQVSTSNTGTDLEEYVLELFTNYKDNRTTLQEKWEKNSSAFRGISTGFWKKGEGEDWRSNSFVNITKQKIMAAYSLIVDIILAGGKIPFMLHPAPQEYVNFDDIPEDMQAEIERSIDDMVRRIDQQLLDCKADRELMKMVLSLAIYGETYAKFIVHDVEQSEYVQEAVEMPEGVTDMTRVPESLVTWVIKRKKQSAPGCISTSVWDIFQDLEKKDVQECNGIFHRSLVSPYWLRQKVGRKHFNKVAIDEVLEVVKANQDATQTDSSLPPALRDVKNRKNTIQYLEFWGRVPKSKATDFENGMDTTGKADLKATTRESEDEESGNDVEVMICVADEKIVRYLKRDPGERPFFRIAWEENLDGIGGIGVADNAENMQLVLNGAMRSFEDNKKLSANVITAVKRRFIEGDLQSIDPGMVIDIADECDDANKAFSSLVIPDVGESLLSLITLAERFSDMDTMIPKITQGIETKHKLTAYEVSQQIEKAGKYLGAVIKHIDEGFIEPIIKAFYEYNMDDPQIVKGKGNYMVKALGFSSFTDKIERITKIQQLLALIMSDERLAGETKIKWFLEEMAKSLDIDPDDILKTEEEKAAEAQQAKASPEVTLDLAAREANVVESQAKAAATTAKSEVAADKLVIERAKAVADIEAAREKTASERAKVIDSIGKPGRGE